MPRKSPIAYEELKEFSQQIHTYNSILSLLHWDQETYMPRGAIQARSTQIAQLSQLIHEKKTGRGFRSRLEKLISLSSGKIKAKGLSTPQKAAVREWQREFFRENKLPTSFVKRFSQTTSEASSIWQIARKENNFKLFAPFLKKIVEMAREKASVYGFEEHPYDALIASYEPCMNYAKIVKIFTPLKKELTSLLEKIRQAKQPNDCFLQGKFDPKRQMQLAHSLLSHLPIEQEYSRLDLSSHPFSIALTPQDSRITTRILDDGFISNLLSTLHEAGHSMYEMGLPLKEWGTPLAEAVSLSIHESQSRWWETFIGRSSAFWRFFYPETQKMFSSKLGKIPLDSFYRALNRVEPSFIRVEADEVTYCLHVILRFELESALISGDLQVHDLPAAWKQKMQELLGITPPTDREGCLQDIHWSLGDFGYFPTYALGNLFAAQFFKAFSKEHPSWENQIAKGEFGFVRTWLQENIHSLGKQFDSEKIAQRLTGASLSEKPYCLYLRKKYATIYQLS